MKKKPFPDRETFERIYSDCLEQQPRMTEQQRAHMDKLLDKLDHAFNDYLSYMQIDSFRYGYECGYEAGLKEGGGDE